jgi:hypothetical protein
MVWKSSDQQYHAQLPHAFRGQKLVDTKRGKIYSFDASDVMSLLLIIDRPESINSCMNIDFLVMQEGSLTSLTLDLYHGCSLLASKTQRSSWQREIFSMTRIGQFRVSSYECNEVIIVWSSSLAGKSWRTAVVYALLHCCGRS